MGSLTLPDGAVVYADTQVIVYSVEAHAKYWPVLEDLWLAAERSKIRVATSDLTLLETLVAPLRNDDGELVRAYEELLTSPQVQLIPVDRPLLRHAAELRANRVSLRTPDAIHAAAGLACHCGLFVTNDRGLIAIPGLPIVVLDDHLD